MSGKLLPAAAAAVMLLCAPVTASAAVPLISGNYAYSNSEICQAPSPAGGGAIRSAWEVADFDHATGKVQFTGDGISGALVVPSGPGGLTESHLSGPVSYSNTATTITIAGGTFDVVYGPVANGIVQSFVYGGIVGTCALSVTMIRQPAAPHKAPLISGNYAITVNLICQAPSPAGGGTIEAYSAVSHFKNGTVKLNGTLMGGVLVVPSGDLGGLLQFPEEISGSYSNTTTKITLDVSLLAPSVTTDIVYGPVTNGIAEAFVFDYIESGCAYSWMAIREPAAVQTAPLISGNYAFTLNIICQAPAGGGGTIAYEWGTADFHHAKGEMTFSGVGIDGDLIVTSGPGGLTEGNGTQTSSYSNTRTTFTVTGLATFNVAYGPIINGIAQSFLYGGVFVVEPTCLITGIAIRQ